MKHTQKQQWNTQKSPCASAKDELTSVKSSSKFHGLIPFIKLATERHLCNRIGPCNLYNKCHLSNSWWAPGSGRWSKPNLVPTLVPYSGTFCGNNIGYSDSPNCACELEIVNISALWGSLLEHNPLLHVKAAIDFRQWDCVVGVYWSQILRHITKLCVYLGVYNTITRIWTKTHNQPCPSIMFFKAL